MNDVNLINLDVSFIKRLFSSEKVKVVKKGKYEIEILVNKEFNGIIIRKTKVNNSVSITLRKVHYGELMLATFMLVYGNEKEKEYFIKTYNKLYYDTEEEMNRIFIFLKKKFDLHIKDFFESNEIEKVIDKYYEKSKMNDNSKKTPSEQTEHFIECLKFSSKIRFSDTGEIYLK